MPKNRGGKRFKRGKKGIEKMIYKDNSNEGQLYGLVKKNFGNGRGKILCEDGLTRLGTLRGNLKKKCRLEVNDVIIICPFDFQDNKGIIIHKYNEAHRLLLIKSGECVFLNTFDTKATHNSNITDTYTCPFTFNEVEDSVIFHAGTKNSNDRILTNGGRVLAITSFGKDIDEALNKSFTNADKINYEGKYYRKDIGFDL